jgi:hypothetical protein
MLLIDNEINHSAASSASFGNSIVKISIVEQWVDFTDHNVIVARVQPTGAWNSSADGYMYNNGGTPDAWFIIADTKMIYTIEYPAYDTRGNLSCMGDIIPSMPNDKMNMVVNGSYNSWETDVNKEFTDPYSTGGLSGFYLNNTASYNAIAAGIDGHPGALGWKIHSMAVMTGDATYWKIGNFMGNAPDPATGGLHIAELPFIVADSDNSYTGIRGYIPGPITCINQPPDSYHSTVVDTVPGLEGVPILFFKCSYNQSSSWIYHGSTMQAFRLDQWREVVV